MVKKIHLKNILKLSIYAIIILAAFIAGSCSNDIFGLFGSTDLDERLKEKNNLKFINELHSLPGGAPLLGSSFSFVVIADTHIENENTFGFEKIKDIAANVDFIVVNGDITQSGYRWDMEKFIDIARDIKITTGVPCYPVIGNHDIYFGNWPVWKELIGSTNYKLELGGATLLILDSANAFLGNDQLDWLESELKNAQGRVFVFSHVNLFVESLLTIQQFTDTRERARVVSMLKDRCDAVFMGHAHLRSITETGNVRYITLEDFRNNNVYCLVTVTPSGISYEFIEL